LDAVAGGLAADDHVVLEPADLPPDAVDRVCGEAAEILQLAVLGDFGEGGAVHLADSDELPAVCGGPAPG
jgi:hypothetical protein